MTQDSDRKKIAVLGGGIGALSAAFGLTEEAGWQDKYEIHVYQLGWRLGGKGASGRNARFHQRIEEHGLHVWGGYYENAFRIMRQCYQEMGRAPGTPLATWQDAFKQQSFITVEEYLEGQWLNWFLDIPTNADLPGEGGVLPSPWAYVCMALEMMASLFSKSNVGSPGCLNLPGWLYRGVKGAVIAVSHSLTSKPPEMPGTSAGADSTRPAPTHGPTSLHRAIALSKSLHPDPAQHDSSEHQRLLGLLEEFMEWLWQEIGHQIEANTEARRLWIVLNLSCAHIRGLIADEVIVKGFSAVEDLEWSAWLRKHGATELTLASPVVRCIYDTIFGFRRGKTQGFAEGGLAHRAMSAQSVVHGLFRFVFTYKGAIFWEMQAGMGDTVFAPLYQVLRERGVQFHFFRRVTNLSLSGDKKSVTAISLGHQAHLKTAEYQPLEQIKGLACWPSEPFYDQLVEGEAIRKLFEERGLSLESAWSPWKDVANETLHLGKEFDLVVLGISLAALKDICPELIAARQEWKDMVENIETVQTQAMQLWLQPDAVGLGWTYPRTMLTSYVEPFDTWADLSHLIARENWPAAAQPGSIAYFCGPLEDPAAIPPYSDHSFPQQEKDRTKQTALDFLQKDIGHLWPNATAMRRAGLNWNLLAGSEGETGVERFNSQYWRANVNPSDRYVLCVPGSNRYRLQADRSGFDNLYVVGDWVSNALNFGCIEGAVMTGLRASRAICGSPREIIGDDA